MRILIGNKTVAKELKAELNGHMKPCDMRNRREGYEITTNITPDEFWDNVYPVLGDNQQVAVLRRNGSI